VTSPSDPVEFPTPLSSPASITVARSSLGPEQSVRYAKLSALGENGEVLAGLYARAVDFLQSCHVRSDLALLAHCIRELLNRLPDTLGHHTKGYQGEQGRAVGQLVAAWEAAGLPSAVLLSSEERIEPSSITDEVIVSAQEIVHFYTMGKRSNLRKVEALASGVTVPIESKRDLTPTARILNELREFFMDCVHVANTLGPFPSEEDIRHHFSRMEGILDYNLGEFWAGNSDVKEALSRANARSLAEGATDGGWAAPTEDEVRDVVSRLGHPHHAFVFFNGLENPQWLSVLMNHGYPRQPAPLADPMAHHQPWPEGAYLAKVATSIPEKVTEALLGIDSNGNPFAQSLILEAATALPPEYAARLVPQIGTYLIAGNWHFNPEQLLRLMALIATGSTRDAAVRLASTMFRPPGTLDDYWYREELPKAVAALSALLGADVIGLLSRWLFDYETGEDNEASRIWRPSIAAHPQNHDLDISGSLVDVTRDAALRIVRDNPTKLVEVVKRLLELSTRTEVSERIAMHVIAISVDQGVNGSRELAERHLLDPNHLGHGFDLELGELGRSVLRDASAEVAEKWFALVENDPEPSDDDIKMMLARFESREVSAVAVEEIATWRRRDLRERLVLVESVLPDELLDRLAELDAEFGPRPQHPGFSSWSESFVGPSAPATWDRLAEMNSDELVTFLREWEPSTGHWFGPTRGGLGSQVAMLSEKVPSALEAIATDLVDLHPTYVRSVLEGWEEALKKGGKPLNWDVVLGVVDFVSRQIDEGDVSWNGDGDSGWRASQKAAASILVAGFGAADELLPGVEHRDEIQAILERLCDSPDPSLVRDATGEMDPLSTALSAVRCKAITALIFFLWWLERTGQIVRGRTPGEAAPEVWNVLDRHLDSTVDPSPAVRATYGEHFPFLASVSPVWAFANAEEVFGWDGTGPQGQLRDVGWAAYVSRHDPNELMLNVLKNIYLNRLRRPSAVVIGPATSKAASGGTAGHVLLLFAWGLIDIYSEDNLVRACFENSSVEERAAALDLLAWRLLSGDRSIPAEVIERLQRLWEWRQGEAIDGADPSELSGFGWWFQCGKFPRGWVIAKLANAASRGAQFQAPGLIATNLEEYATEFPSECLTVMEALIYAREPWQADSVGRHAAPIITAGLKFSDAGIQGRAKKLLETLGELGHLGLFDEVRKLRGQD
jgi:hypothetical protein